MVCNLSEKEERKRLTWADSMKGIAICAIVWVHSGGGNLGNVLDPLGRAGAYWVEMFFILTVYFAHCSLEKRHSTIQKSDILKTDMYWFVGRVWKLTPLYYSVLLVYLIIIPPGANIWLGTSTDVPDGMNILMHLLYLHGLCPYYANSIMWVEWYLGTMVIYLVLLVAMCRFIKRRRQAWITVILCIIISVMITDFLMSLDPLKDQYIWEGWVSVYSPIAHLPSVAFGTLLYFWDKNQIIKRTSNLMFIFALTGYVICSWISVYCVNMYIVQLIRTVGYSFVFFILLLSRKVYDCPVLNNFIWQKIGQNSYGIYLVHFLLVFIGERLVSDEIVVDFVQSSVVWQGIKFVLIIGISLVFSIVYDKVIGRRVYKWGIGKLCRYFT